jgi:hypothetical protein
MARPGAGLIPQFGLLLLAEHRQRDVSATDTTTISDLASLTGVAILVGSVMVLPRRLSHIRHLQPGAPPDFSHTLGMSFCCHDD